MTTLQRGGVATMISNRQEALDEKQVTYAWNLNGGIVLIENVPARINEEIGEQVFSPLTTEQP